MPNFRRGAASIEEAATSKAGNFRPFVPRIELRNEGDSKHLLFLTPVDDIPTVELYEWIPVGAGQKSNGDPYTKYEQFISRRDPAIAEASDELHDRLDQTSKSRNMAVAVELEPTFETDDKGREKVVGFTVATDTYTRKDDDAGEVEVTQPLIGLVVQSPQNFFGWLSSYDSLQGPIEETPMHVARRGQKTDTTYDFIALENRPVNFGPLLDYIDGVSYMKDEMEGLEAAIGAAGSEQEAAMSIAATLLDKRLEELSDKKRYDELVGPIEEIVSLYGKKPKPAANGTRRERPQRASRRTETDAVTDVAPEAQEDSPREPAAAPTSRSERFASLRAQVEAKAQATQS